MNRNRELCEKCWNYIMMCLGGGGLGRSSTLKDHGSNLSEAENTNITFTANILTFSYPQKINAFGTRFKVRENRKSSKN